MDAISYSYADSAHKKIDNIVMDDITDVDTTTISPNADDLLVWDGSNWVPSSVNSSQSIFMSRNEYVATDGQVIFAAEYEVGYIDVFVNSYRLASTDFDATNGTSVSLHEPAVLNAVVVITGYSTVTLANSYTKQDTDTLLVAKADLASPDLTGIPTTPTANVATNTTQIASTEFVYDVFATKADLDSPVFTGTPTSTTAASDDDSTQIATTAFVNVYHDDTKADIASPSLTGVPLATTASSDTNTTQIATTAFVYAHNDLYKADLDSPTFIGAPIAPTATTGTNTTQIATTAFVQTKANLASPAFTGAPTAPTAVFGSNSVQLATTAFVKAATDVKANSASPSFTGAITKQTASMSSDVITATSGSILYRTLGANTTFTDGLSEGQEITLVVINAGFTITYPTIEWWEDSEPTLGTKDKIKFEKINSILYGTHAGSIA